MHSVDICKAMDLLDGGFVIHAYSHPVHSQLVVGFPNGYAVSIIRGAGTYGHKEGLYELAYAAYDKSTVGLDKIEWEVVSYDYATRVLMQSDSIAGWLTEHDVSVIARNVSLWQPYTSYSDVVDETAETCDDEPVEGDDSYDEFPDEYLPIEPYYSGEYDYDA